MASRGGEARDERTCGHCREADVENAALRAQLRTLQAKYEELLRMVVDRDYERPPHYC